MLHQYGPLAENPDQPSENGEVREAVLDKKGYIWLAVIGGLVRLEPEQKKFRVFKSIPGVEAGIDQKYVHIPPLLLQPFVENAVWHGLMHKTEGGLVSIDVRQPEEDRLRVEIEDDGVGRIKAAEYKSKSALKQKSFGIQITTERLKSIHELFGLETKVQIFDLVDLEGNPTGTKVVLDIPV